MPDVFSHIISLMSNAKSWQAQRSVGPGVPLVATRNGEYLLAIRRDNGGWRPVIYYLVLFHAMLTSSCDR